MWALVAVRAVALAAKPNIVFILADDQDQVLGGMDRLPEISRLLGAEGANFTNFFVNTPVCCPSRAEIVAGRYGHNNLVKNGTGGCMHANITGPDFLKHQLGTYLSELGYRTALFGKYMNNPACTCPEESGCKRGKKGPMPLPPGWDRWFSVCTMGGYFHNEYNDDGEAVTLGGEPEHYMTSVIGNRTVEWLEQLEPEEPFFAYVAPHAPHVADTVFPFVTQAAPWYAGSLGEATAPRTPNWNQVNAKAHPVIANQAPMDDFTVQWSDSLYRARQESMLSVDDLVAAIVAALKKKGVLDQTYFFFSSDHGYALGQQARPSGKFHVYENDIRVPMLVRGPGVQPGLEVPAVSGLVDLAATWVDIAGGDPDQPYLDGRSLLPWLQGRAPAWRDTYLIEYWSLGDVRRGAPESPQCNPSEGEDCVKEGCTCHYHKVDGVNNTYVAARHVSPAEDFLLVQYYADKLNDGSLPRHFGAMEPVFIEAYDLRRDPWQMSNLHPEVETTKSALLQQLRREMFAMSQCSGKECRNIETSMDGVATLV